MLTTEARPTQKQWQPHPFNLGKWDGWKGHLPTEEYLEDKHYQQGYFEGIKQRYLVEASAA